MKEGSVKAQKEREREEDVFPSGSQCLPLLKQEKTDDAGILKLNINASTQNDQSRREKPCVSHLYSWKHKQIASKGMAYRDNLVYNPGLANVT